ncbi:RNA polymerase sigma factor [Emticicia sp. SJ17W-69]|uniref:RNA polymerase sigma factor n=1 Tax=Emticicia sp. SJ17W-69 TaxID=3421657 RepID=UPI003EB8FED3
MEHSNLIETSKSFWEKTYHQNINQLIGVGYRYTTNRQLSEDLAHDAFLLAYEKVNDFEGKGPFEAWLRRIMVNHCLQYLRNQQKQKYLTDYLKNTVENNEESMYEESQDFSEDELLAAINQLPEHHKMAFNLYVIDGFTHAQIAQELSISEGTSKSHLARARKKIKELLNNNKKKSIIFLLFWNIDELYKKRFKHFELSSSRNISFDSFTKPSPSIPVIKPGLPFLSKYLSAIIAISSIGVVSLIYWINSEQTHSIIDLENNKISKDTATISENRIISKNNSLTKNANSMKNLKAIGLIASTAASLATNSQAQTVANTNSSAKMEVVIDKPQQIVLDGTSKVIIDKPQKLVLDRPTKPSVEISQKVVLDGVTKVVIDKPQNILFDKTIKINDTKNDISGTFYGEKLHWSAKDNELYFEGKSIIAFGENHNIIQGTANVLGKIHHLVVNGKTATVGDKIKLTNKKYHIRSLSPKTAMEKYGDAGKKGAVEIELAE